MNATGSRGAFNAAIAMSLVGSSTAISATIVGYPLYSGQAIRYGIAALVLIAVLRIRRPTQVQLKRSDYVRLAALAMTGLVGFNICLVEATKHADLATIATIVGAVPVVLAIAGPAMQRKGPNVRITIAAIIVLAGTALASGTGTSSIVGLLLAVGALVGEVAFSLLAAPLIPRLGPLRVATYPALMSVPMLLIAGIVVDGADFLPVPTVSETVALVYLGVIVTAVAFFLWYTAIARMGVDKAGLFAGLVPASAIVTGTFIGMGVPEPSELIACALVGIGIVLGIGRRLPRVIVQRRQRCDSARIRRLPTPG
ncbi:MAG: DMT family transporter [Corynebacteriales bacterium]|nr:DMT family transporter [Mycobacteriales bacterium]